MKNKTFHDLAKIVGAVLLVLALLILGILARGLSVEDILRYTPNNPILAALVVTLMTAAATLIPIFPMMLFYFACGMLFPFGWALFVGAIGIYVSTLIGYALGRGLGCGYVTSLLEKYPKLSVVRTWQSKNDVFMAYLLRVLGILPVNMVSLFMGAMNIRLFAYLLGTTIGMAPGLISCVLISMQVKQGLSWQLILAIIALNAASFVIAMLYKHFSSPPKTESSASPDTKECPPEA